jgi:hypothetical protein
MSSRNFGIELHPQHNPEGCYVLIGGFSSGFKKNIERTFFEVLQVFVLYSMLQQWFSIQ